MGHKRQHMAPLACICRKSSLSIKQQDKILRESAGSGALCGCGYSVQERRTEMKVRDFLFPLWHFSNVQLLPNYLSKSFCASLRACAKVCWECACLLGKKAYKSITFRKKRRKKELLSLNAFLMVLMKKRIIYIHKRRCTEYRLQISTQNNADLSKNNQFYFWVGTWDIINRTAERHTLTIINHSLIWPRGCLQLQVIWFVVSEAMLWPWILFFRGATQKTTI